VKDTWCPEKLIFIAVEGRSCTKNCKHFKYLSEDMSEEVSCLEDFGMPRD
jgi:hypothetical protein